ncbi:MAG: DNA polymerase III subunit epsilon [Pseudomonadota bacterium]|nr:DNA polymerase III subunit epsilon [Pseudomonadota bacterium]
MREIVLDTETTGFRPDEGHRIVEIGCVELVNLMPTGNNFQVYLNPERDMPLDAFRVHGLSSEFLADKQVFADIMDEFLEFLGDSRLVIHNAGFDMRFINAELVRAKHMSLPMTRTLDTVTMARKRFPGGSVSLDALCRKFAIDNSGRGFHGALLDSLLLADVYLELSGGRQPGLILGATSAVTAEVADSKQAAMARKPRPARQHAPTPEEGATHAALVEQLDNPIWNA